LESGQLVFEIQKLTKKGRGLWDPRVTPSAGQSKKKWGKKKRKG